MKSVKRRLRIAGLVLGGLVVSAIVAGMIVMGPRNFWGILRWDQRQEGTVNLGASAPDFLLTALDGTTKVKLLAAAGTRPIFLIFGSYT